ncbi:ARM repeat-containing protein [Backusella circina FSU 941]|nr:ARM repeat-containing protein [Backusella circina FSU 941]
MGKQKQRRRAPKKRNNPINRRVESGIKQASNKAAQQLTPEQLTPIVQKLSSQDSTERAWSAACISNLILTGASVRKALLSKGIVPTLIQLLSDAQQEVRDEALGALRNLCSVDHTVAKEYYNRNIMKPLSLLLPQITSTIDLVIQNAPIQDEADQERRKTIWEVTENFIYIIWGICEASDKYVTAINRMNIVTFLISFLISFEQCPTKVVIAAGQCLNTLVVLFPIMVHLLSLFPLIQTTYKGSHLIIYIYYKAILLNIRHVIQLSSTWDDDVDEIAELHKMVVPVLVSALDYDIQQAAENTLSAMNSGNVHTHKEDETAEITPKPKQPLTEEEIYIQNVEDRLSITQLALELLADICVQDDIEEDGVEDADESMMEDGEEEHQQQQPNDDEDDEDVMNQVHTFSSMSDDQLRQNSILHAYIHQIFPQLIRLSTATPISFEQIDKAPNVTRSLTLTHQRSLECMNNFLLSMNEVPTKYWFRECRSDAVQLWRWLFGLADQVATSGAEQWAKEVILETAVGCLWALGRGLTHDIPLSPTDVGALCGTYEMMSLDSMRVKIIGCLGPIAMRLGDIETNKASDTHDFTIGIFLMNVLQGVSQRKTSAAVTVEALNDIFDVYSDCEFDYDLPVFVQGGFLNILKQTFSSIRSMVKSIDRRKQFDLRMRADEALDNLNAFIKYKKSERK